MKYCISCLCPIEQDYGVCPYCGYAKDQYVYDNRLIEPETRMNNRYFIGRAVYIDSFGASYMAYDEIMQRKVIIRQMLNGFTESSQNGIDIRMVKDDSYHMFRQREHFIEFYNQLSRMSRLTAIPEIFAGAVSGKITYAVYEYTSDKTVEDFIITNGRQDYDETTKIVFPMVYALRELHSRNMYHGLLNTRNIRINPEGVAVMYDFPGVEIERQSTEKYKDIIRQNKKSDVENVIMLILMIMTGSISPIKKDSVNAEYFESNQLILPEKLRDFILSALCTDGDSEFMTMEHLFNAMYDNQSVESVNIQSAPSMRIPQSVFETAAEVGCRIIFCTTSLENVVSQQPKVDNQSDDSEVASESEPHHFT